MSSKKLTKKEHEYLVKRLEELEKLASQSSKDLQDSDFRVAFCCKNSGFDDLPNYEMYTNENRIHSEINEIRATLNASEIIEQISTEEIGIGTKFVATANGLDGVVRTRKYTLFNGLFMPSESEFILVSVNSPFGQAVLTKREKDEFSYVTPDKKVISGVVDEIISEKDKDKENLPKQLIK